MPEAINCPLCAWLLELEEPPTPPNVALAGALGMSTSALAGLWSHQQAVRVENELDKHLRTHTPQQWLPALMQARQGQENARRAGMKEGRSRVIAALHQVPVETWVQQLKRLEEGLVAAGRPTE